MRMRKQRKSQWRVVYRPPVKLYDRFPCISSQSFLLVWIKLMICIQALIAAGHHLMLPRLALFVCKLSYPPVCSARYRLKATIEMRNVFVRDSSAPPAPWQLHVLHVWY